MPNILAEGRHLLSVNAQIRPEPIFVLSKPTIRLLVDTLPVVLEAGDTLHFTATGFHPGESLQVFLDSINIQPIETMVVGADYRLYGKVVIPRLRQRAYYLLLIGDQNDTALCTVPIGVTQTRNYEFESLLPPLAVSTPFYHSQIISFYWWAAWSQQAIVLFEPKKIGDSITFAFSIPERDSFMVYGYATIGSKYGNYSYALDGEEKGSYKGYLETFENREIPSDTLKIGKVMLDSGQHSFTFRYKGRDPKATDSLLGADHFVIVPLSVSNFPNTSVHPEDAFTNGNNHYTLRLFPNPSSNDCYIELPPSPKESLLTGSLTITDLLGKYVYRTTLRKENKEQSVKRLQLPRLSNGKYIVRLQWSTGAQIYFANLIIVNK